MEERGQHSQPFAEAGKQHKLKLLAKALLDSAWEYGPSWHHRGNGAIFLCSIPVLPSMEIS